MLTKPLHLIGAGGHGKVVLDALLALNIPYHHIILRDQDKKLEGKKVLACIVDTSPLEGELCGHSFHLGVGQAEIRESLFLTLIQLKMQPFTAVHPSAVVSKFATLGFGTFVAANAVIGPLAHIGKSTIINHGAIVDHDCKIGDFSHIAPCATLGGGSEVGNQVLIGAGANILPFVSIGDFAIIGAGAVVTKNVPPGTTYAGIPAKKIIRS